MEFIECRPGLKRDKANTVAVFENFSESNLIGLSLFTTRVAVVSKETMESEDCVKVTAESGHHAYIRTELFEYAESLSEEMYISTEYPNTPLLFGISKNSCIVVCPLSTASVEMYQ